MKHVTNFILFNVLVKNILKVLNNLVINYEFD